MDAFVLVIILVVGFLLGIMGAIVGNTLLILVPLLNFFGLPIHTALGTAKISIVSRELIPLYHFNKKQLINFKIVIPFIIAGSIFSFIGTKLVITLDESFLKVIIAVFMVIIGLMILLNPKLGMHEKKVKINYPLSIILGSVIGFYQGIFGGGTNTFIIFAFVLLFGNTFLKAVANSKMPNLIFAFISVVVFVVNGFVDWVFAVPLLIATGIGSYFGAKLAIKKGNKFIRVLFVILVIGMAVKMVFL